MLSLWNATIPRLQCYLVMLRTDPPASHIRPHQESENAMIWAVQHLQLRGISAPFVIFVMRHFHPCGIFMSCGIYVSCGIYGSCGTFFQVRFHWKKQGFSCMRQFGEGGNRNWCVRQFWKNGACAIFLVRVIV